MNPTIGWSQFALDRHKPSTGYSYFFGIDDEIFNRIERNWDRRTLGSGSADLNACCLVPIEPDGFYTGTVLLENARNIETLAVRRRPGEDLHLKSVAEGPRSEAKFVNIVLYSHTECLKDEVPDPLLAQNLDFYIISINASDEEDEPMHPLAMARNQLYMPGGNPRKYSSDEWARAVWYWSKRVAAKPLP